MVEGRPWGFIKDGPLFGYLTHQSRRCNNPFWDANPPAHPQHPWHLARADPNREPFGGHCVAVVQFPNQENVVDVCHGSLEPNGNLVIYGGGLELDQYVQDSIDVVPQRFVWAAPTFTSMSP